MPAATGPPFGSRSLVATYDLADAQCAVKHEVKQDGFRLMARRDAAGVRLLTRNGHDWTSRFPQIAAAVNALRCRSCLSASSLRWSSNGRTQCWSAGKGTFT
jgi:ATP-dependent DNA ligase